MIDRFQIHLRASGYSVTPPRLAVFKYLQDHDQTTVAHVLDGCRAYDRASVYRTLGILKSIGVAEDVIINGKKMIELCDPFDVHHHHLTCTVCGTSISLEDDRLEAYLNRVALRHGLRPTGHQIEVTGLCQACDRARHQTFKSSNTR